MLTGESPCEEKTYTVRDLIKSTEEMLQKEMRALKKRPLTVKEAKETEGMAKILATQTLKQMRIL